MMTAEALAAIIDEDGEQTPLPEGWRLARLGDIADVVMGQSPSGTSYNDKGIGEPLLNGPSEFGRVYPTAVQWTTEPVRFAEVGDILFCVRGATTGKKNLADRRYCIGRGLAAIRGKDLQATTEFLIYLLDFITESLLGESAGSTFPNLSADKIENFKTGIPSLEEQKRIAAVLDEQMNAVAQARAAVEAQLDAAQRLPNALLCSVFESEETQDWEEINFGNLVDNYDGVRIPLNQAERVNKKGIYPYYGASGIIDYLDEYIFDGEYLLIGEDGANLLSRSTPIAFKATGKFWVNNHAHVVKPKEGISMDFLIHFFAFTDLSPYVNGMAQPKLNQRDLNAIPVLLPPNLATQNKVAEKLNTQMREVEALKQSLTEQLAAINKMPAALLRKAFAGEI